MDSVLFNGLRAMMVSSAYVPKLRDDGFMVRMNENDVALNKVEKMLSQITPQLSSLHPTDFKFSNYVCMISIEVTNNN